MSQIEATETTEAPKTKPWYWYVAAGMATLVSTDTSWRFFGSNLHITDLREKVIMFAVLEIALVAAGLSMAASVRRHGTPGSARLVAWGLAGASGYMAVELSGLAEGIARVGLGPVLAIVALHQALGIEIKARIGQRTGTWAKIGRELKERALSRMGLGNDERDAKRRTMERAAVKAATIATSNRVNKAALRKAVLKSGAATDPTMQKLVLNTAAALKSLDALVTAELPSPWTVDVVDGVVVDEVDVDVVDEPVKVPSVPKQRKPRELSARPTSGGPTITWDVDKAVQMTLDKATPAAVADAVGIHPKIVQRTTRVVRALAEGKDMLDIVKGDITAQFAATIRTSWLKAMDMDVEDIA